MNKPIFIKQISATGDDLSFCATSVSAALHKLQCQSLDNVAVLWDTISLRFHLNYVAVSGIETKTRALQNMEESHFACFDTLLLGDENYNLLNKSDTPNIFRWKKKCLSTRCSSIGTKGSWHYLLNDAEMQELANKAIILLGDDKLAGDFFHALQNAFLYYYFDFVACHYKVKIYNEKFIEDFFIKMNSIKPLEKTTEIVNYIEKIYIQPTI